jgi:phage gpG-like protein
MARGQRWDIEGKIKAFQRFEKNIPRRVGNIALNHFLESWDDEAFSDSTKGSNPWAKRKTTNKADRTTGRRRQLLIDSGALKRSMKVSRPATFKRIAVGSYGIKYAEFHNQGTSKLPKRQFVGKSAVLDKKIKRLITTELKRIL